MTKLIQWVWCVVMACCAMPSYALIGDAVGIVRELTAPADVPTFRPAVSERTLSNGMRCYFAEDHLLPLFRFTTLFPAGAIYDPAGKRGLYSVLATLLETGGSAARTPDEIDDLLDAHAIDLHIAVGWEQGSAGVSALADERALALQMLFEQLYTPRFDPMRFALAQKNLLDTVARQNEQPAAIGSRIFRKLLYGADNPWGRSVTRADAAAITRNDVQTLHATLLAPRQMLCAAAGDFDADALVAELEQLLAPYADRAPLPWTVPSSAPSAASAGLYFAPKALPQAVVYVGERALRRDDPNKFAMYVANEVLGSQSTFTSWLLQQIRTKLGLAYEVWSTVQLGPTDAPGVFQEHAKTRSAAMAETVREMHRLTAALADGTAVQAADVTQMQGALLKRMIFQYADRFAVVSDMAQYVYLGLPAHYADTFREGVRAVTLDDVRRVAREYLHPDRLTTLVVGDPATVLPALKNLREVTTLDPERW